MGNAPNTGEQQVNVPARTNKANTLITEDLRVKYQNWIINFPFSRKSPQISTLLETAKVVELESNNVLLKEGENAVGMFFIVSGIFEVFCTVVNEQELVLKELSENESFGEVSVMYDSPCTASVRSVTRSKLIQLKVEDVKRFFVLPPNIPKRTWYIQRKYIDINGEFQGSDVSKEIALTALTKAPIFHGWSDITLKHIINSLKSPLVLYPPRSTIYLPGYIGKQAYILVQGRVQFSTEDDQELAVFDAGDNGFCFGEEGLFSKAKRRSVVRALTTCQIIVLTAENFHDALDKNPADKMLLQLTHQKWKDHISKRNNELYEEYSGALDMEILRMALKQTKQLKSSPPGLVYIIALSTTVKKVREEQAVLSHKQYSEGQWMFLVLKGSAILVNDDNNTEEILDAEQIFSKTPYSPSNAWVKANELSIVAIFPKSAVSESQETFPDVILDI